MANNHQDIIDLIEIRKEKQSQTDDAIQSFYDEYVLFVMRYTNIREKVRASHLFCERTGLSQEQMQLSDKEYLFQHWFAFDYVTIQGRTLLQQFISEKAATRNETFLIQSALFLTSVLEPIIVSKVCESFYVKGYSPLTNKQVIIKDVKGRFKNTDVEKVLWVRKIKSLGYDVLVGSYFIQAEASMEKLHQSLNQNEKLTWRQFLKRYAVAYLTEVRVFQK
ncbi:nicotinate phosphoribosyltransferase [Priestia flexa]|uniref:nicotinate phosphoribosyltransferase n=1 Tax=Priestia flexa TaxID=86664 RepID=UPI001F2FB787|nr:nicotinate phosphoribosyltransferase [Priestia flexa]UIR29610.1 nicotinate phosphoribosyltransferase [Priestia flexa]